MRKTLLTLAAAALVAVPVANANQGHNPGGPHGTPPTTGHAGKHHPSKVCKPVPHRGVGYVIRGVLALDASSTSLSVDVTSVNHHAKVALAGTGSVGGGAYSAPMLPVTIDSCTRIQGRHGHSRSWQKLKAGDRVVITWKAPRGTAYLDLGAATRVVDRGPLPTPAS